MQTSEVDNYKNAHVIFEDFEDKIVVIYPENKEECLKFLLDIGCVINCNPDRRVPQGLNFYTGIFGIKNKRIFTPRSSDLARVDNHFHSAPAYLFPLQKQDLINYITNGNYAKTFNS